MSRIRSLLCCLLSFSIFMTSFPASYAQSSSPLKANCNVTSEADFRFGLEGIISKVMKDTLSKVNYRGIVDKSWKKNEVDKLIDRLVTRVVKKTRNDKSLYELISTLGSSESRTELAKEVAEGVFGSDEFKQVITVIAKDIAEAISGKLDAITTQVEGPVAQCIRKFVGPQYGQELATLVSRQTQSQIGITPDKQRSNIGVTDLLTESSGGLTGALIIVLRRAILQRLGTWIGRRIIGTIVTRAIGAVAGILGWLLIAKELWDLRLGILPILEKSLKSDETKKEVKAELVSGLNSELNKALEGVPREVAARIFEVWTQFKQKNEKVLYLAKKYPEFRRMLREIHSSHEALALLLLRKASNLVKLTLDIGGEEEFLKQLRRGKLKLAVLELTEPAIQIAIDTKSIDKGFAWSKIAKNRLEDIQKSGLHKYSEPGEYDETTIKKLLSLKHEHLIKRFAQLSKKERDILFELSDRQFNEFIKSLTSRQLAALTFYIKKLDPEHSRSFLQSILKNPDRMRLLSKPLIQTGIINSYDQKAALEYMLRESSVLSLLQLPEDIRRATNGDINPLLLWLKEPVTLTLVAFLGLFILLMIMRALFGRRTKVIIEQRVVESKDTK